LAAISIGSDPVQYWSDPNDMSALLYDGQAIWAAAHGGVVRWQMDGSLQLYTPDDGLASQAIQGLALDGDGHVWVGYADYDGWSEYDGAAWHTYETRQQAVEQRYAALLAARHTDPRLWSSRPEGTWLWLPTFDGQVNAYDGTRWRLYTAYSGITAATWLVAVSDEGRVWAIGRGVSTAEEGDVWWDDHSLFADIPGSYAINDLAVDKDGGMWLAYGGGAQEAGGVCRLDWAENRWAGYMNALNPDIPTKVHSVVVDADGTVWLCGEGGFSFHRPGTPWKTLHIAGVDVKSFARDREQNLWLGTSGGLWHADAHGENLQGPWCVPAPLVGSQVRTLAWDAAQRLWVGTTNGLSFIEPSGATGIAQSGETLGSLSTSDGSLWLGGMQGLWRAVDGTTMLERTLSEPIVALAQGPDGALWWCTQAGSLARMLDGRTEQVAQALDLAGALPRDLAVDSAGTLWFATELGLGQLASDGTFLLNTVEHGLLSEDVRAVAVGPEDLLWVATAKGLARRRADGRWTRFTSESTEGGLRDMELWDVWVAADGTLWMATDKGISRRTPENADWCYYDVPGARCIMPGPDGALWVGTLGGLYRIEPSELIAVP
jgi:ligand-binding sensor domain-containing protein